MTGLVLHNYFRSSASVRVRIALNLKQLSYKYVSYHLRKGEHREEPYLAVNPQGLVPALELESGEVISQSLAIIEYLDEVHPEPPLLPSNAKDRARVRALALAIACDIHPVNNLRVQAHLKSRFGGDDAATTEWFKHWVTLTFDPLEGALAADPRTGKFCHGNSPGLADLCLFPQVINNRRFKMPMTDYPVIQRIFNACANLQAFADAAPERQPDAE